MNKVVTDTTSTETSVVEPAETSATETPVSTTETASSTEAANTESSTEQVVVDEDEAEADEFSEILSQFEHNEDTETVEDITPPATETAPASEETASATQTVTDPAISNTEVTPPAETVPGEIQPQPAASTTETQTVEPSEESLQEMYSKWHEQTSAAAAQLYQLSPEDEAAFEADPGKTLSTLAGKMHVQMFAAVYSQIVKDLPNIVPQIVEHTQATKSRVDEFYAEWPELREHDKTVEAAAAVVRQQNPGLSKEEVIQQIGVMACLSAGVQSPKLAQLAGAQRATVTETQAPVIEVPPPPSAASSITPPASPPEPGPWDTLVEIHEQAQ